MWNSFIEVLVQSISSLSSIFGSSTGLIILISSLFIRFALLPLTVKIATGSLHRQRKLQNVEPQLNQVKQKFANDPEQLSKKTLEIYKKNDISFFDKKSLIGALIQTPLFIGMISAINRLISTGEGFLWIRDIASPDIFITTIAAGLALLASIIGPVVSEQGRTMMIWMPVLLTMLFLWKLSAGIGIYWVATNLVNVFQSLIVRHKAKFIS